MVAGRVVAGPHVRDSCARHLRDLKGGRKRGLRWRPELVERVLEYFREILRLAGGEHEGKPFAPHLSQAFILGSLFGWLREDGSRRFRMAFIEQGKGCGKTPLAAGIGHYMTGADGEPRAETYAAATDKEQATILFRDAISMAKQSPALSSRVTLSGGEGRENNIAYLATHSFFRPISSESRGRGKSGFRPHCVLLDEIHEHPSDAMVEFLRAGTKFRRQPLIFMITNSGVDRNSVAFQYHDYGAKVAAGEIEDDSLFSYICALDDGSRKGYPAEDPFTDPVDPELGYPRSWLKANPLLGVTIQPSYLEERVRQARGMPATESLVRRLNFCQWVDAVNPWIDGDLWRACEVDELPEEEDAPEFLGLDLSGVRDLTAAARVHKLKDGRYAAELRFWSPADTLEERARKDRVPYDAWVRSGHLIAVPGRSIDYGFVVRDLAGWLTRPIAGLAFDPWKISDFQRALDNVGVDNWIWEPPKKIDGAGLRLVRHGQGWGGGAVELDAQGQPMPKQTLWMPRSISVLESAIVNRLLLVLRNPVLTYASASAVLARDPANNAKWEKRKSTGRIDGIVALCQAIGLADEPPPKVPNYDIYFLGASK